MRLDSRCSPHDNPRALVRLPIVAGSGVPFLNYDAPQPLDFSRPLGRMAPMVPFSCAKAKISSQANGYAFPPYRFSLKLLTYFRLNRQKILSSGEGGSPTIRILAQLPAEARFLIFTSLLKRRTAPITSWSNLLAETKSAKVG